MESKAGKFSFEVPEGHPEQGNKVEKSFEYQECSTDEEAVSVLGERKWKLAKLVNDKLRTSARANAYQNALLPYKRTDVSAEDATRAIVRNLIGLVCLKLMQSRRLTRLFPKFQDNIAHL